MKKKVGRPKLKAKERKEIFPLRLSAVELDAMKEAAKDQPLSQWMRKTLLAATPLYQNAVHGAAAMINEATGVSTGRAVKPAAPTHNRVSPVVESRS